MLEVLCLIAARLERIEHLEAAIARVEAHHVHLERKIMSLEQQLIDAGVASAAANTTLIAKVDSLIAVADASAKKLAELISLGGPVVSSAAIQQVIDSLTAVTSAATAEAAKVDAAAAADAPPVETPPADPINPPPADPVDPPADPVDPAPVDPAT